MIKISYTLFLSLALITIAYGMEPNHCEIPVKKSSFFSKKNSTKSLSSSAINKHKEVKEHPLIFATRNKDHTLIKFYLSDPYSNPNSYDLELNTALHYAAMNEDHKTIELFLNDHRIDASMKNINHKTARELVDIYKIHNLIRIAKINNPNLHELEDLKPLDVIKGIKNLEDAKELAILRDREYQLCNLRRTLFARATLDIVTTQECNQVMSECKKTLIEIYQKGLITPELINTTILNIKNNIIAVENHQAETNKDRTLPSSAQFPSYATDDFIMKMIYFRLSSQEINSTWLK